MTNLNELYNTIQNLIISLAEYDSYSPYQETVRKLDDSINKLCEYFGIHILKRDIGAFYCGEAVKLEQNEAGVWIVSLDNSKSLDLYDYMIPLEDLFYD